MKLNPFKVIKYQLYLLQLENYELFRYFKLLWKKGLLPKSALRKDLVWTVKARSLFGMSVVINIIILLLARHFVFDIVLLIGILYIYFTLFSISVILMWPLDFFIKNRLVNKAHRTVLCNPQIKIIGIAGSYGKTTMKEVLAAVLSAKFKTAATPDSINTPVGIARWVLQKFNSELEIAVIEMGEHYKGDVKFLCNLARPDISLVTGINEAHMERMGNIKNITDAILEIVENAKPGALIMGNADDRHVAENLIKHSLSNQVIEWYSQNDQDIKGKRFDPDNLCWIVNVEGLGEVTIPLLGEYAIGDVLAAIKIGRRLGMTAEEIKKGILNIKSIEHRLQPILGQQNVLVIDDSYNGNPDGFKEAMAVLERFTNRRKLCITPGLVETGKGSQVIHEVIGKQLAAVSDKVLLIKNSVTPFIAQGLKNSGFPEENILWFNSAPEAHAQLSNILKPGDVILFQNDWGDQYL